MYTRVGTGLGQSVYPGQWATFSLGHVGQWVNEGILIIQFIFLKMATIHDSEQNSKHLLMSHCHSSEHNSVSETFLKEQSLVIIIVLYGQTFSGRGPGQMRLSNYVLQMLKPER